MAEINRPNGLSADLGAYLGPGTKINGKLHFDAQATIDGEVEGEIVSQAHITVGQQATVKGKISAVSILVQGKVIADVQAEKRLEVQPPGSVIGDVTTQSLVIGDGAVLEGHVSMRKSEGRVAAAAPRRQKGNCLLGKLVREQRNNLSLLRPHQTARGNSQRRQSYKR